MTVPVFRFAAEAPIETIPKVTLLMLLFIKELLLFPAPRVEVLIVALPDPRPANVAFAPEPTMLQFLIVLFVGASPPGFCIHITALVVPAFEFVIVPNYY